MINDIPQGWTQSDKRLTRKFEFSSFAAAIAFMVEVSLFCERTDHHPEWKNIYNKLWVTLSTHDAGKVTDKDRDLAKKMDEIYRHFI